jgi:hypothetical protein
MLSFDASEHPRFNKLLENLRIVRKQMQIICQELLYGNIENQN